jgi:hypothetical protein
MKQAHRALHEGIALSEVGSSSASPEALGQRRAATAEWSPVG